MHDWLHDAVTDGVEIVTASRRLARGLRAAHASLQRAHGVRVWRTAQILSWDDWLVARFEAAGFLAQLPLRIGHNASALLWEQCLRERIDDGLLNPGSLVREAQDSWQRLSDWCVPLEELSRYPRGHDQQLYLRTAGSYQRLLERHGWVDQAALAGIVKGLFAAGTLTPPRTLIYAGFDRLTPAIEALLQVLRQGDCDVRQPPDTELRGAAGLQSFADSAAELRAAGNWARELLSANPATRIAIVRAGLETRAERTARLVREGLASGWQYGGKAHRSAVNISYGRQLADYPAVAVALTYLRWLQAELPAREVSLLLRSRLSGGQDTAGRSRLELRLRKMPDRHWTPAALVAALRGRERSDDAQAWLKSVEELVAMRRRMPRAASPAAWAARFDELLLAVGWPGNGVPDSEEFQLLNRWRSLLNEFAALELVAPQMSFAAAVRRVAALAADSVFQPQTTGGLVDVLGPLEAAGLRFDALWISGLDAGHWPPAGNPSQLLPRSLQRDYAMPDATPGDTLEFSKRVFARLVGSADQVVLSWARQEQDTELAPSPLLESFAGCAADVAADPGWHALSWQDPHCIVAVTDDPAPPVGAGEAVGGGAYTVQRQAMEPFSAFAYGRLRINELAAFETGLPAHLRGSLVHDALHALYADVRGRDDLQAWAPQELEQRVSAAAAAAIRRRTPHTDARQQRLLQLEQARLQRLLARFIEMECSRSGFSVAGVEQSVEFERHGVRLGVRIDRIDRQADGALLVIDYKTGQPRNLLTRDGEPADLQLVVYAAALTGPVAGLALVNLDSRDISYKGAGGPFEKDPESAESWSSRLAAWEAQVDTALRALAAGDVRVNVRQSASQGRPLSILSRLEELRREC